MKQIVIYGINQQAQALCKMLAIEGQAEVKAFSVDGDYFKEDKLLGRPVITTDHLAGLYPPDKFEIALSFGYKNMVHNREEKFLLCKRLGYSLYTFISRNAAVYSDEIGEGCIIYPGTVISPNVVIGKGCFFEIGCVIAHNTKVGDFNFFGPGVHFCGNIHTGKHCFFGSASEVINNTEIGDDVFVAAGAKTGGTVKSRSAILPPGSVLSKQSSFEMMEHMFKEKVGGRNQ